jgi:RHS repeat-associated protein
VYDGLRNRVKKIEEIQGADDPVKEIRYVLDMTRPYDNLLRTRGAHNQSFVWGNDLISASGDENLYYLQDHLGSPIRLLGGDGPGTPLAYDEFGVPTADSVRGSEARHNPFGFTGYLKDDVTGLYCARAREYDAGLGRFAGEDPAKSGRNWYSYCGGNPMRWVDPRGLALQDVTQTAADALIGNPINSYITQHPGALGEQAFHIFGFDRDSYGIYHARQDAEQQRGGYNVLYDIVFDYATSMKTEKFPFTYDGQEYIFWAWRGDYLNLGAIQAWPCR